MGVVATTLTAIAGVVGLGTQVVGMAQQASAQRDVRRANERAELIRRRQAQLEEERERRRVRRQASIARGLALTAGATQGALGSSGVQGGLAQISTGQAENIAAINDAAGLGRGMFDANAARDRALGRVSTGQGLSSLGGAIISNSGAIGRLGAYGINSLSGTSSGAPMDTRPGWA